MATLHKANGIVLARRDHREADRWYCAFTREHGKVEFLARGGHKPLAKLTPHLEMMAEVELLIVNGRAYFTVAGVERRKVFPTIYQDFSKLVLAKNALHLVDIGTRDHERDTILYDELVDFLETLNAQPTPSQERGAFLLGAFGLKLMAIIGYRPELHRCLACKKQIEAGQYRWHALKGGVVCANCVSIDQEQWFAARPVSDEALKLVRFALTESFAAAYAVHLPGPALAEFHEMIESLIINHFPTIPANSLRESCLV